MSTINQQEIEIAMKKDIIEKLKQSKEEIEKGEGIEIDEALKELKQKFGY